MVTSDLRVEVEIGRFLHAQCIQPAGHSGLGYGAGSTFHRTYLFSSYALMLSL